MNLDGERAVSEVMATFQIQPTPTPAFLKRVTTQVRKHAAKMKEFGCLPRQYRQMGLSPRLASIRYGESITSAKQLLRLYAYKLVAGVLEERGCSLVDVKPRSPYTRVLLGLYPTWLLRMKAIMKSTTLWNCIKKD